MYGASSIMHLVENKNLTIIPGDARDKSIVEPVAQSRLLDTTHV